MNNQLKHNLVKKRILIWVFSAIALACVFLFVDRNVVKVMLSSEGKPQQDTDISYCVSPVNNRIVFTGAGNGYRDLYSLETYCRIVTRLTDTPLDEIDPAFSSDGQWLVYSAASRPGGIYHLYVQSVKTRVVRQVTSEAAYSDTTPAFGVDNKTLIFARTQSYGPPLLGGSSSDIYSLEKDSGHTTQITHRGFFSVNKISLSPDGDNIVFSAESRNRNQPNPHCFLLSLNRRFSLTEIQDGALDASDTPCFARDGQSITFTSDTKQSFHYNLVMVGIHKTAKTPTVLTSGWYYSKPAYSSDGTKLFCLRGYDKPALLQMNAAGSAQAELASFKLFEMPLTYDHAH